MSKTATYPSLARRVVVVTGGADGIGEATVRAFAAQGSRVAFVDIAEDKGRKLAEELGGEVKGVHFMPVDVTDTAALQAAIAAFADRLGPIRVLVNNAANDQRHDWRAVTPEEWDSRMAVNIKHYFFAIQAVAPGMIEAGGGSIVNFGSISWMIGAADLPVYTAAKAATHGQTRFFARNLGKHGIRVNTVLPGWVMTRRQLELWVDAEAKRTIEERQCLPGRVQPADLARMVLFLASDDSAMSTGQSFFVDGGWV